MVDLEAPRRLASWLGFPLTPAMESQLERFGAWLEQEAIPAGGLGPAEADRIGRRHLADSLAFAVAWWDRPDPPRQLLDLGSGVGLPGVPLAILHPETSVVLLDRSGRRCTLARRAARILGLPNVEAVQGDMRAWTTPAEAVVSRASLPPPELLTHLRRLVEPEGVGVVGGPRQGDVPGFDVLQIPSEVLDPPPRILIMAPP